jgi:hypothetical protein
MEAAEGPRVTEKLPVAGGVVAATLMALMGLLLSLPSSLDVALLLLVYVRLWYARTCRK